MLPLFAKWLMPAIVCSSLLLGANPVAAEPFKSGWKLIWHDEFKGPAGSRPDPAKWVYDVGNGDTNPGWGNNELERYSSSTENVFQDGFGHLVIRANRTLDGTFTSGRIKTQGRFSFIYGRIEARIKVPYAQGIWPTFWMLGAKFPEIPWPISGEIDIMENFGAGNHDAGANHGTLHGPGYAGAGLTAEYHLPDNKTVSDDFHIFSIEWSKNAVKYFVDGNCYATFAPENLPSGAAWVFNDTPFFLLLNVAVGGSPAPVGYPADKTHFPQDMLISYVRVYQRGSQRQE
jgi:beta-glucanase (GH16 family)